MLCSSWTGRREREKLNRVSLEGREGKERDSMRGATDCLLHKLKT